LARKAGTNPASDLDLYTVSDAPIESLEQDLLGREEFVGALYKEITNLTFADSFVFGLYGSWGEGKTSVLNLLITKLRNDDNCLPVDIDPWYFKGDDSILAGFYQELEKAILQRFIVPGFARVLAKYRKMISPKIAVGLIDLTLPEEGLEQIKIRLERHIARLGKRLVIVVDDIDRLQPNEIAFVMKLVRLNTRLKGTIFVLSFDHEATSAKLDNITGGKGADYIAKIVQKPVKLPKIEQTHLNRFVLMSDHPIPRHELSRLHRLQDSRDRVSTSGLIQKIYQSDDGKILTIVDEERPELEPVKIRIDSREKENSLLQSQLRPGERVYVDGSWKGNQVIVSDMQGQVVRYRLSWLDRILATLVERGRIDFEDIEEFDHLFVYIYRSKISKLIQNLRDAKRYINSLASSLPPIAEEVNIKDFCLLEFLKVFRGDLYDDIFDNWWFYVDARSEDDVWISPLISLANDETKKSQIRKQHVDSFLAERVNNLSERELFTELLKDPTSHLPEAR